VSVITAALFIFFLVTYFSANEALNEGRFSDAKSFFVTIPFAKTLIPDKYAYADVGTHAEKGEVSEAVEAYNQLKQSTVPNPVLDELNKKMYEMGQIAYRHDKFGDAFSTFDALGEYERSLDYLTLIFARNGGVFESNKNSAIDLIGFEDASDIVINNPFTAIEYLTGSWIDETNTYYFVVTKQDDSYWFSYNTPANATGHFYFNEGVFSIGTTEDTASEQFKFIIQNPDKVLVICYADNSEHFLYRQDQ